MRENILSLLGLMRRANAIAGGEVNTGGAAKSGKAKRPMMRKTWYCGNTTAPRWSMVIDTMAISFRKLVSVLSRMFFFVPDTHVTSY